MIIPGIGVIIICWWLILPWDILIIIILLVGYLFDEGNLCF
jgi:hypothetical protein